MRFFSELRRRNVFRVAAAYAVSAWLIAQVAELVLDGIEAPVWVFKSVLLLLALGFPIALIFAWAYELTPEGIKPEREVVRAESITRQTGKRLNLVIIGVLLTACAFLLVDKFVLQPSQTERDSAITIAVLPFENRSSLQDDSYFVDGIHDDLLTRLSQVKSWRVISRTSVEGMSTSNLSIPEIGERLGATHIIEGSVQRAADSIRVTIQLIDAGSDNHVWAPDPYDRELNAANVFAIQTDIARSVSKSLRTVLSLSDQDRVSKIGTESLEAYEKYLKGRERLWERTGASVDAAVRLFQDAVELDDGFAAAWAGLGDAYRFQHAFSDADATLVLPMSEQAHRRAIELDPRSGEAWAGLGLTLFSRDYDIDIVEDAYRTAIELNPNYAYGRMWYANFLSTQGRLREALEQYEVALQSDPENPELRINMAIPYLDTGQYEKGADLINEHVSRFPNDPDGHMRSSLVYAFYFGQYDKAIRAAERAYALEEHGHAPLLLARLYLDLDDTMNVMYWLDRYSAPGIDRFEAWGAEIRAYAALRAGESAVAYEYAERGLSYITDPQDAVHNEDSLVLLRDRDLQNREFESIFRRYEAVHPAIVDPEAPQLQINLIREAADAAWALQESGEVQKAAAIANRNIELSADRPRGRRLQLGIASAKSYMVLGSTEEAIQELTKTIDEGWRSYWWYVFDVDPAFTSLREQPAFRQLRQRIESDISAQLSTTRRRQKLD